MFGGSQCAADENNNWNHAELQTERETALPQCENLEGNRSMTHKVNSPFRCRGQGTYMRS
jgi:hypothetical protein